MAIIGRTATVVENASTLTITGTRPTDRVTGDITIATYVFSTTAAITGPSGWTALFTQFTQGPISIAAYYAIDPAADPTASYSGTAGRATVICQSYGGINGTPIDVAAVLTGNQSTSLAANGVTTATPGALLISGYMADSSSRVPVIPSGMTQVATYSAASVGRALSVAQEYRPTAGATGTRTWSLTPSGTFDEAAYVVALRPAAMTGTRPQTATLTGELITGMSGARPQTASIAGPLRLGMLRTGTRPQTATLTGQLAVISRQFVGKLEIEFTAGTWTDVTNKMNFQRGPLRITQGKKSTYDDIAPGIMSFSLYNANGEFISDNASSPYYPNVVAGKRVRWQVTKSAVTYTRFVGWIQSYEPDFPTGDLTGASVAVSATDALGLLAQRKMRSNFTERSLALARSESVDIDVYEAAGETTGFSASLTNYSEDAGALYSGSFYATTDSVLDFGNDNESSFGGVIEVPSADSPAKIFCLLRTTLQIILHVKTFGTLPGASEFNLFFSIYSSTAQFHLGADESGNIIAYGAGGSVYATVGVMPRGQWVRVKLKANADPTKTNISIETVAGDYISADGMNFDIRAVEEIYIPGLIGSGKYLGIKSGGILAINTTTSPGFQNSFSGANNGTTYSRVDDVIAAIFEMPITFEKVNANLMAETKTGTWDGKSALQVLNEIVRSEPGAVFARPKDGHVAILHYHQNPTHIAVIDIDADCNGIPKLVTGSDDALTRVEISIPSGNALYISPSEGDVQRSKKYTSTNRSIAGAKIAAGRICEVASSRNLRIKNIVVDLVNAQTDHTAALFDETAPHLVRGLYPGQRIRTIVPAAYFGAATLDHWVIGWVEEYSPRGVTVALDTIPAS